MEKKNAKVLLEKYTAGLCTEEEQAMVENWYLILPDLGESPDHARILRSKKEVWRRLSFHQRTYRWNTIRYMGTAAMLAICLGTGIYFSSVYRKAAGTKNSYARHDIAPGGNKATLILADGKKIVLDDKAMGKIAEQSGVTVTKTADGQLSFQVSKVEPVNPEAYNSIVTPRGGQYQISLPDGTRVWLNASSALKFPSAFSSTERRVELSGEAYFEVAKNPHQPFKVITSQQLVEVLGTHFNINSYRNEAATKTVLLEGAVKVSSISSGASKVLKPGQQSIVHDDVLDVFLADTEEALAWKNGLFIFNNEELESIMRKVSRWYDVDVVYKNDEVRKDVFGGSVSRFGNVSEILRMLEITGNVHFSIDGNKIIVMKK